VDNLVWLLLIGSAVAVLVVWRYRKSSTKVSLGQLTAGVKAVAVPSKLTPKRVQEAALHEMFSNTVVTLLSTSLYLSGSLRIAMSSQAYATILSVKRRCEHELETHIPELAAKEGLTVGGPVHILFVEDPGLAGLRMRVEMYDDDVTPYPDQARTRTPDPDHLGDDPDVTRRMAPVHRLNVIAGAAAEVRTLPIGDKVVLGRSTTVANWAIPHPYLSNAHAELATRLRHDGGLLTSITDLRSTNGTWINEVQILPDTPTAVRPGDTIRLGPDLELRLDLAYDQ
jgi:hypothetical protein